MLIAEIGSVHDGSFGNALKLIELASECGANAVKFQTHISDAETLPNAPNPGYFQNESRSEYFKRTGFSKNQWKDLKKQAEKLDIVFLSSPFSLEAVDLLEDINITHYKIASGEVTNSPLLEKIAMIGKPVILSSGMSNWKELDNAVSIFKGNCDLTVMQCTTAYPCPPEKVGLNILTEIKNRYDVNIGFSDHTSGLSASIAAATLGAQTIEKHLTFSKKMYGSDAQHSMEPNEFKLLSRSLHELWEIIKNPINKDDLDDYYEMKNIFQKSIVSSRDLNVGEVITFDDLLFKKPGTGISANEYKKILGKTVLHKIDRNNIIKWEYLK